MNFHSFNIIWVFKISFNIEELKLCIILHVVIKKIMKEIWEKEQILESTSQKRFSILEWYQIHVAFNSRVLQGGILHTTKQLVSL